MLLPGNPWRCCVSLLLFPGFALAQTGSREITGLVTDATGAAVPGAGITITRVATREFTTGAELAELSERSVVLSAFSYHIQNQAGRSLEV